MDPSSFVTQEPGPSGSLLPPGSPTSPYAPFSPLSPHSKAPQIKGSRPFPDLALALGHLHMSNDLKRYLLMTP